MVQPRYAETSRAFDAAGGCAPDAARMESAEVPDVGAGDSRAATGHRRAAAAARSAGRRPLHAPSRVSRTLRLLVEEWGWPVVPGTYLGWGGRCSCGDRDCAEPGRHQTTPNSYLAASADTDVVHRWWAGTPLASVVLPVGWRFDVLEVPEVGGREALCRLELMGYRPAPVIADGHGRLMLLVAAGARREMDEAAGGPMEAPTSLPTGPAPSGTAIWVSGSGAGTPDVIVHRSGVLVAPLLGPEPAGASRWLLPPAPVHHPLPRVEDVLGPVLQACREADGTAAAERSRIGGFWPGATVGRDAARLTAGSGWAPANGRTLPPIGGVVRPTTTGTEAAGD